MNLKPTLYIGDTPRKPRGCWPVDSSNPTGEVRWLASTDYTTTLDEFERGCKGRRWQLMRPRLRAPFKPTGPKDYRTRSQPVLSLDESGLTLPDPTSKGDTLNLADTLGATEIPSAYLSVVILVCKRAYFQDLAEDQCQRELLPEIGKHYERLLKIRMRELAASGEWHHEPRRTLPTRQAAVVEQLNELFLHGLGFTPELKMVSQEELAARANPLVQEYMAAGPNTRRQLWQANHGVLSYLLTKARVPTPGKYRRNT